MSRFDWDVAVIGGGPAGCSAAISLAQRGMRVILFETQTYPHDKLCGEFLSPECTRFLTHLGAMERLTAANPVPIRTALITAPGAAEWQGQLPGTALGLSRNVLDAILAERAHKTGADVREASTVYGLTGSLDTGFSLAVRSHGKSKTVSARVVIGAHGRRGAIDRLLGRKFLDQPHPFVAIKAHFHGPSIPNQIRLHTFPGGYCGISDIEGDARILCLLVHEKVFQQFRGKGKEGLDSFIAWMQQQNPAVETWMSQAERIHERWIAIAQVPFTGKPVIDGDVVMVGDAAGLIPPLAGNGISMALEGGMLAAGHLSPFLEGQITSASLRGAYSKAWQKKFGQRLKLGRALQPIMLRPRAVSLTLRVINTFPWLGQYFVDHTRGIGQQ